MAIAGSFGLSYPIITYTHSLINTDFPDSLRSQKQSTCFSACWVFVPKKGPLLFAFSVVVPIFATRKRRDCGLFIEFMGCFCCHGRREALFFRFLFCRSGKAPDLCAPLFGDRKRGPGRCEKNNFFYFAESKKPFTFAIPKRTGPLARRLGRLKKRDQHDGFAHRKIYKSRPVRPPARSS